MSVPALTPTCIIASEAARFSVAMVSTAVCRASGGAAPALQAVVMMPVPMGLVSTSASPGWAPALVTCRPGSTSPTTDRPYFGSLSSTVWPPAMRQPASVALS